VPKPVFYYDDEPERPLTESERSLLHRRFSIPDDPNNVYEVVDIKYSPEYHNVVAYYCKINRRSGARGQHEVVSVPLIKAID